MTATRVCVFMFLILTVTHYTHDAKNYAPLKKIFGDGLGPIWRNRGSENPRHRSASGYDGRPGRARPSASAGATIPLRSRRPRGGSLREFRGAACAAGVHSRSVAAPQLRVPGRLPRVSEGTGP